MGEWVWTNKASYNGLSILAFDNENYKQAPFEEITKIQSELFEKSLKTIDLTEVYGAEDERDYKTEAPLC